MSELELGAQIHARLIQAKGKRQAHKTRDKVRVKCWGITPKNTESITRRCSKHHKANNFHFLAKKRVFRSFITLKEIIILPLLKIT